MTALQIAVEKLSGIVPDQVIDGLREDDGFGPVCVNLDELVGVRLLPLTACEDPVELGYVKKLLEMSQAAKLLTDRNNKERLTNQRAKQVKRQLNYIWLANCMFHCGQRLNGPLKIRQVWRIRVGENGHGRTMLSVIFTDSAGNAYGFYFHLRSALLLCGLRF